MSQTARIAERTATAGRELVERVLRQFDAAANTLPDSVPALQRRQAAEQLRRVGWPSWRDESWRYANVRALEKVENFAAVPPHHGALPVLPAPIAGFQRLVFLDGVRVADSPAPISARPAAPAIISLDVASTADQRLGLLNDLFARDSADLYIEGEAAIELLFVSSAESDQAAVYPRLRLELAPNARLQLIERHLGASLAPALVCASSRITLGRDAQLTHYRLQQYGARVMFFDTLAVQVGQNAEYRVRQTAVGGAIARTSAAITLAGAAAAVSWQALAAGRHEQIHDTALEVVHSAPATRTEEVFRGIADEHSRIAFAGHVRIDGEGVGSQARQSLRGLIEGPAAEMDLRPRLEINTDEVTAQHGATTGRLDENLLFYLLSRGIDPSVARALLKWAFLSDVLRTFEIPSLRREAERAAAGQLQDVLPVGELT